ncbi:MAG: hypothetical protein IKK00_05915 [Oscillospiraceae bacterium]|nr:hypothetical protein [Oscillospiraceae bacterium]
MGRMSARYVGRAVGMPSQWVYDLWHKMGLVVKDKFGDWVLTDAGRQIGGKMTTGSRLSVPSFDFSVIEKLMIDFYNKTHK